MLNKKNGLINGEETKELNKLFKKYYQDAKEFKLEENLDADYATVAVDSAVAVTDYAEVYEPYSSSYKTSDIGVVSLAIDNEYLESYMKVAPEYCKNLKTKIPTFSDKDLGNLVYNYAGQVCDLYIYNSGNVSLNGTIDALRKSVLEINNKYEKLKKEDKEKLTTFLNSLD